MTNGKRKGISTVLTTVIIVVASIVLATALTLFSTSLFQSGTLLQGMQVSNQNLWVRTSDGISSGAFVVRNTGDKVLGIDNILVRGQTTPFADWWYNNTSTVVTPTKAAKQLAFQPLPTFTAGKCASPCINFVDAAEDIAGTQAVGPVTLETGQIMIMFFKTPTGKLTAADLGSTASLGIYAGTAGSVQTVQVAAGT